MRRKSFLLFFVLILRPRFPKARRRHSQPLLPRRVFRRFRYGKPVVPVNFLPDAPLGYNIADFLRDVRANGICFPSSSSSDEEEEDSGESSRPSSNSISSNNQDASIRNSPTSTLPRPRSRAAVKLDNLVRNGDAQIVRDKSGGVKHGIGRCPYCRQFCDRHRVYDKELVPAPGLLESESWKNRRARIAIVVTIAGLPLASLNQVIVTVNLLALWAVSINSPLGYNDEMSGCLLEI
jgi:hypothetical protein